MNRDQLEEESRKREEEERRFKRRQFRLWLAMFILSIILTITGFALEFSGVLKDEGVLIGLAGFLALIISVNSQMLLREQGRTRDTLSRELENTKNTLLKELENTRNILVKGQRHIVELIRGSKE